MSKVEEIISSIESLSKEEFDHLRKWFYERDWERWDKQIEADSESGKLDFLVKETLDEKSKRQTERTLNAQNNDSFLEML
ncbi:MAG: hypothetical protein Kow0042_31600 [Calditrichia bacterium]